MGEARRQRAGGGAGGEAPMIVEVHDLWKRYGRYEALQGLGFAMAEGSAFALVGPNGAGKTTTIKVLMNLLDASRGRATILGVDSRAISPRELADIGYVSENQDLPGRMTVGEYLAYLRPFYPRWDRALETSMCRDMQLPSERKIRDLSHGMRIKMALVCALSFRPRLLILDEPFAGLDPLVRDELLDGLLGQAGELTILISSHELGEIEGLATDVGFLHAGRMLFQEPMGRLIERCREVYVTLDATAQVPHPLPAHWLHARAAGNVLMFVETQFTDEALGELVRTVCDGVRHIDAKPMSLRSIFTTLAPAARDGVLS
jgi:ABC-2 type transport system ATP-binding protein